MCAEYSGDLKWRGRTGDDGAEADAEAEGPPYRGAIAPGLQLLAREESGVCWKSWDRAHCLSLKRGHEPEEGCWRIVSPGLLCDCADCGIPWKSSSDGFALPVLGALLKRPVEQEEECLKRRSARWRLRRRRRRSRGSREVNSPEMGTLWDVFGPVLHTGPRDSSGCGIQRIFSRERVHDDEEKHRCILHFPSMREFFTHEEVERVVVPLGWKPLTKRGGWRRYFKFEEPALPHGLPTIAKLPARSFVDAPKPIILEFVRTVNKRENRNIFCCWEHRGELLVSAGDRTILC